MKMSLTLSNFPMLFFELFTKELAKYAEYSIQVGGEDTVFLTCNADMVKCMEVVAIADKYAFGGDSLVGQLRSGDSPKI